MPFKKSFLKTFFLSVLLITSSQAFTEEKSTFKPIKVLFIGNSYTDWVAEPLNNILTSFNDGQSLFSFHTRGSTALIYFAEDQPTLDKIKSERWDYVVLQEWSQGVGRGGEQAQQFDQSLSILSKAIRQAGAQPILYMTWGRDNTEAYDSYESMSQKIIDGYLAAGRRHNITVAPVGIVWKKLRTENKEFTNALYEDEIGHPSIKGQFLISSVFFKLFFDDSLAWFINPHIVSTAEHKKIVEAVNTYVKPIKR